MSKLLSYYLKRDKWILLAMAILPLLASVVLTYEIGPVINFMAIYVTFIVATLMLCYRDYKRFYGEYSSFFQRLAPYGKRDRRRAGYMVYPCQFVATGDYPRERDRSLSENVERHLSFNGSQDTINTLSSTGSPFSLRHRRVAHLHQHHNGSVLLGLCRKCGK